MITHEQFNKRAAEFLPGYLGIKIAEVTGNAVRAEIQIEKHHMAPNGYLHAGTVITLADTSAAVGCIATLPEGASGFTTIETKSNHLGTAVDGTIESVATPQHLGRNTQVWDVVVKHRESGKTIALFRCTQMVLYPRAAA